MKAGARTTSGLRLIVFAGAGFLGLVTSPSVRATKLMMDSQDYQNRYQALNIGDVSGKINSVKELLNVINVKGCGAIGNGVVDDTAAIQGAVTTAAGTGGVVYFPPGTYKVSSTIVVTDGTSYGCRLEGANAGGENLGVTILSTLTGTDPVFSFRAVTTFSNVGIRNMTITAGTPGTGTGIEIDGQVDAQFHNVQLIRMNYGVWLYNHGAGSYGECNQFHEMNFYYCNNGVRMEYDDGDGSFHGNVFRGCYFDIDAGQIGFNVASGHYYNGRFQLVMRGHSADAVYVNADGYAETNVGDITIENAGAAGKITGSGTFWYRGSLSASGGVNDVTASSYGWKKVFVCDNYFRSIGYGSSGMTCGPLNTPLNATDGPQGNIVSLGSRDVQSVLINCRQTGDDLDNNGLFLGRSTYDHDESSGTLGIFLSASGAQIKSFCTSGLCLVPAAGNVALRATAGTVAIGDGTPIAKYLSVTMTWAPATLAAGARTSTTVTVPGAAVGDLVLTSHDKITTGGLRLYGTVTAANTVTVTLHNETSGTVTLTGGTLRVSVLKHGLAMGSTGIRGARGNFHLRSIFPMGGPLGALRWLFSEGDVS